MSSTLDSIQQACTAQCRIDSPLGPLLLARTAAGLAGVWFDDQQHHPAAWTAPHAPADPLLRRTAQQLSQYFEGESVRFDAPLDLHGTAFQRRVWQALLRIERGATRRYGEIAAMVGEPAAARAVGAAVGRNPLSIIVPCHRVLGVGGALTGYAGGLGRKVALLEIEQRCGQPAQSALPLEAAA
jgi:methylated-DNA-[protein]-cysteine S-methyltransferase